MLFIRVNSTLVSIILKYVYVNIRSRLCQCVYLLWFDCICFTKGRGYCYGNRTLRHQDTSAPRHFGTGAELSHGYFGTGAEVFGNFGTTGWIGLTKAWRDRLDSENGQSACPVCIWQAGQAVSDSQDRQMGHADRTMKIAHLPVPSGTGRRDNGKGPFFLSLEHTTDGAVKKHVYYDAKGQWII